MSSFNHSTSFLDVARPVAFKNASHLLHAFENSSNSSLEDSVIDDYIQSDYPVLERAQNPLPFEFLTYSKQIHKESEFSYRSCSSSFSDTEDTFVFSF
ncbi:hypothetical protein QTN25_005841 [Entamoeba marina]